jgi:hypothetical protein
MLYTYVYHLMFWEILKNFGYPSLPCPPPIPACGTNPAIGQRVHLHSYHSVNTIDSPSHNRDTALIVLSAELNSTEIVRTVGTRSIIGCFGLVPLLGFRAGLIGENV